MEAIFESYSGFTTTGSTIIDDFNDIPHGILAYRALTGWIGGLGFTLFIIIFLRRYSGSFNNLFNAEFSSINKEKIYPHIFTTVTRIFIIYTSLTVLCFLLLCFSDMDVFSAFCHSLSTVSTCGFSTSNGNIGAFDNYAQWVLILMMFLSGTSYIIILYFFQGKWKKALKDEQFRTYFLLIFLVALCFTCFWFFHRDKSLADSIRQSFFCITSIVSTTGFDLQINDFGLFASVVILFLMFIGGCSASSSTGLKIIRVIILAKYAKVAIRRMFHKRAIIPVRYNKKVVLDDDINVIFGFFFLYLLIFLVGAFLLSTVGNDFNSCLTMSAANISNIGPMVGSLVKDFSYSSLNVASQIILICLMMIGRLEIYSFIAIFSKSIWGRN
jgi:trk system potassium uptake protein TrkH